MLIPVPHAWYEINFKMDKTTAAVEQSHWKSSPVASSSNLVTSTGQIASIAIDLNCAIEEIESPVHEHFSIRGFVAGLRKEDPKMSLIFAAEGGNEDDDLPLISVPRFRWWQCPDCVQEYNIERITEELMLLPDSGASNTVHMAKCPDNRLEEHKRKPKLLSLVDIMEERNSTGAHADVKKRRVNLAEGESGPSQKREKTFLLNRKTTKNDERKTPIKKVSKINATYSSKTCTMRKPSTSRVVGMPFFDSLITGKRFGEIFDLSGSESSELDDDHCQIMPTNNSQTSPTYRYIPDLNKSFVEDPFSTQGNLSEKRSFTSHKNVYTCETIAREGEMELGVSDPQTVQEGSKNVEHCGASDDIPMEIVELMAMYQHERELANSGNHLFHESIDNPARGTPNDVRGYPDMINFSLTNARSGGQPEKLMLSTPSSAALGEKITEGADYMWPPWRKSTPLHHRSYKGKTIGDGCAGEGRVGLSTKSVGSSDSAYSNNRIPAMQLLSLMEHGIVPGSSFNVPQSSLLGMPYSLGKHHTKDSLTSLGGNNCSGESSKRKNARGQKPPCLQNTEVCILGDPSNLALQLSTYNPAIQVCTLNRNPADFSIPDAKNEFTLCAKDLKSRKKKSVKVKTRSLMAGRN